MGRHIVTGAGSVNRYCKEKAPDLSTGSLSIALYPPRSMRVDLDSLRRFILALDIGYNFSLCYRLSYIDWAHGDRRAIASEFECPILMLVFHFKTSL